MQRSIYRKTTLLFLSAIFLLCSLMSVFTVNENRKYMKSHFTDFSQSVFRQMEPLLMWDDRVQLKSLVDNINNTNQYVEYVFIELNGEQFINTFASGVPEKLLELHDDEKNFPSVKKFRSTDGNRIYDIAMGGNGQTLLHVGISQKGIDGHIRAIVTGIWIIGIIVFAMTIYLSKIMSVNFEREIDRIMVSDKERAEHLRAVLESTGDGILVVDRNGKVAHRNARFIEMWKEPSISPEIENFDMLVEYMASRLKEPQDYVSKIKELSVSRNESLDTLEFKDGRFLEVYSCPLIIGEELAGRVWSLRDVTQRMKAKQEKEKLQEQLLHSQKMEAIGVLAGGVAHDFNNLLGIIMGSAQLAMLDTDKKSETAQELALILESSRRAKDLTMKLLTFARKDKAKKSIGSVRKIIYDVTGILSRSVPKNIRIKNIIHKDINILCDANQMHQAIMNICTNAADAMPAGGELTIECEHLDFSCGICSTCGKELKGRYCVIQISDTGIGISDDMIKKVADPFFTTKGVGKGTGLGLSVTLGIIENHDGHMHIYSELGKGTCVKIFLPMSDAKEAEKSPAEEKRKISGNETILMIDDETPLLEMAGRFMKRNGYAPLLASEGRKGIELFEQNKDRVSVVVLDLMMPELDGPDVFRELMEINPDVRIIFASGYSINSQASRLLGEGNHRFIQKPFDVENLCVTIREVIDGKR